MTPLAKSLLDDIWHRYIGSPDQARVRASITGGCHFMRVDEHCARLVNAAAKALNGQGLPRDIRNPTSRTWIEGTHRNSDGVACDWAVEFSAARQHDGRPHPTAGRGLVLYAYRTPPLGYIGGTMTFYFAHASFELVAPAAGHDLGLAAIARAALAISLLNSPQLITCRTVQPIARLNRRRQARGKYPLMAWREIKIKVDRKDEARATLAGLTTGTMPLHYVRRYIRRSTGAEVAPHWRGDAANGVVPSRYLLTCEAGR